MLAAVKFFQRYSIINVEHVSSASIGHDDDVLEIPWSLAALDALATLSTRLGAQQHVQVQNVEVDVLEVEHVLHAHQMVKVLVVALFHGLSYSLHILLRVLARKKNNFKILLQFCQHLDQVCPISDVDLKCLQANKLDVSRSVIAHHLVLLVDCLQDGVVQLKYDGFYTNTNTIIVKFQK